MPFLFEAHQIRKSFSGVEVLHGVDLLAHGGSVLALLGENGAGKSTLVKIMAGDYQPDSGELRVGDATYHSLTPIQARRLGVSMIFQEFQDAPTLTVAENIALGRLPNRYGVVSWRRVRQQAIEMLKQLEIGLDPDAPVSTLRVGERQIVEIARSLVGQGRLLILDEPTAALSQQEADTLFGFVRRLRSQGVAIIYITHRLDEVTQIADRVQVLRDGSTALLEDATKVDRQMMVEAMVGRRLAAAGRPAPAARRQEHPALRFAGAGAEHAFQDVTLEVRPGEVVALFGKLGSGAAEIAEAAFGLRHLDSGQIEVDGRAVRLHGPASAIQRGIGMLPPDRKAQGAFLIRSVAENVAAASWPRLARWRTIITRQREAAAYRVWHDRLSIRSRNDPRQSIGTLSGGNQQKVLLARWLERRSRVLMLVEPTRGVDVGARSEIYGALRELAALGIAILIVTSDYEDVVHAADRAVVIARGTLKVELHGDEITANRLLAVAGG